METLSTEEGEPSQRVHKEAWPSLAPSSSHVLWPIASSGPPCPRTLQGRCAVPARLPLYNCHDVGTGHRAHPAAEEDEDSSVEHVIAIGFRDDAPLPQRAPKQPAFSRRGAKVVHALPLRGQLGLCPGLQPDVPTGRVRNAATLREGVVPNARMERPDRGSHLFKAIADHGHSDVAPEIPVIAEANAAGHDVFQGATKFHSGNIVHGPDAPTRAVDKPIVQEGVVRNARMERPDYGSHLF